MFRGDTWVELKEDIQIGLKLAGLAAVSIGLFRLADHFSPSNYDENGNRVQTRKLMLISAPQDVEDMDEQEE